jgi:hypothetical protein
MSSNGRVQRLRMVVLVLVIMLVFAGIAAPVTVIFYTQEQTSDAVLRITCTTAEANVSQLKAVQQNGEVLDDIARSLGLPIPVRPPIVVPELPAECR